MPVKNDDATVIRLINPDTGAKFDYRGQWLRNSPATDRDIKLGRAQFRGDKVYLRLPPGVQAQLDKGILMIDTDYEARRALEQSAGLQDEAALPMPPGNGSREAWISYAVNQGMGREEASMLTRDQIKSRFAEPEFDPDAPPEMTDLNDKPAGA